MLQFKNEVSQYFALTTEVLLQRLRCSVHCYWSLIPLVPDQLTNQRPVTKTLQPEAPYDRLMAFNNFQHEMCRNPLFMEVLLWILPCVRLVNMWWGNRSPDGGSSQPIGEPVTTHFLVTHSEPISFCFHWCPVKSLLLVWWCCCKVIKIYSFKQLMGKNMNKQWKKCHQLLKDPTELAVLVHNEDVKEIFRN